MKQSFFNLVKEASSRKRIKDRHISWKETYRERSEPLKKKFNKELGEGSYYRWEGHDYTTNGDYFIIVGPALTKEGRKQFFAGIKRYPPQWSEKKVYAPSGEYFTNIASALTYAKDKWGMTFPPNQVNYSVNDLVDIDISRHLRG